MEKTTKVKSIRVIANEDVYDITVENNHNFFANGLLVHNCGEQPLPPEGSCLLGSINLARFVLDPFTDKSRFDWESYIRAVRIFTRMLDNVVEVGSLPLEGQRHELEEKRRHGMGYLGLGSACSMMGMTYGDEESVFLAGEFMKVMAVEGFRTGIELAHEKGCAPILNDMGNRSAWIEGQYMSRIWSVVPELKELAWIHGCRFTHHTSIAPTGTISLTVGNNCSNGIEPSFAHKYTRNIIRAGKKSKEAVVVYSYEMLAYKEATGIDKVPDTFSTTASVTPTQHVDIQASAQVWCDSSISKTINVPTNLDFEDFKNIYMYAYDKGLKGCTTFRFNPEAFQGVLVNDEDLESTQYQFTLADGTIHTLKGNDIVMYEGEESSAANLFDAHKEGYYGKL